MNDGIPHALFHSLLQGMLGEHVTSPRSGRVRGEAITMAAAAWLVGFVIAILLKECISAPPARRTRSIVDLNEMVEEVTGREGFDFLGYGNWCGIGGSGPAVDELDRCCKFHDLCYDFAMKEACSSEKPSAIYNRDYKWFLSTLHAYCSVDADACSFEICKCDTDLVNCFGVYSDEYKRTNRHRMSVTDLFKQLMYVTN